MPTMMIDQSLMPCSTANRHLRRDLHHEGDSVEPIQETIIERAAVDPDFVKRTLTDPTTGMSEVIERNTHE